MAHKTIAHDKLFHLLLVQSGPRWLRLCLSISMRDRDIISSAIKGGGRRCGAGRCGHAARPNVLQHTGGDRCRDV